LLRVRDGLYDGGIEPFSVLYSWRIVGENSMSYRIFACLAGLALLVGAGLEVVRRTGSPPVQPPEDPALSALAAVPSLKLDAEQKEYLWQIEHHGNLLSRHGFKALAAAIQKGDGAALQRLLAPDFAGETLGQPRETVLHSEVLDVVRHQDSGAPRAKLNAEQFVARLLEFRKTFGPLPSEPAAAFGEQDGPSLLGEILGLTPPLKEVKVKFSLMGLAPTKRGDLDSPWRGTALLRLWGEWQRGKPAEVIAYLEYRVRRPTSENLAAGGWLSACALTQAQVGKAERYLMRESAAERGIDPKQFYDNWKEDTALTQTGGVFVCDFNRDGILDLLIVDVNGCFLYQGRPGGSFVDVTTSMGLERMPSDLKEGNLLAAFADLDGDGWEDLILGDKVYGNDQGRRFVDQTDRCNLRLPGVVGVVLADYDRDGLVDVYGVRPGSPETGSWLSGKSGPQAHNFLYRNKGNWQFEDATFASGTDGQQSSTFSAAWLDADDDGWPDLYVINEFGDGILYHNQGRGSEGIVSFRPHRLTKHPCDFGSMGIAVGDVFGDGRISVYCANMYSKAGNRVIGNLKPDSYPDRILNKMRRFVTGSQLHRNLGGLRFEQVGQTLGVNDCGWAYGPALIDLDNDGWLDLHATCGFISRSRDDPDG
jgi:hypothetical protein